MAGDAMSKRAKPAAQNASVTDHLAYLELVPLCPVEEFSGPVEDLLSRGFIRMVEGDIMLTKAGAFCLRKSREKPKADAEDLRATAAAELEGADRARRKAPPMKETAADRDVSSNAYAVTADELRQFIERFEQLEAEKADVAGQQKELAAEAKGRGYSPRVMRKIIAIRKRKPADVAEEDAILEMYKAALGMA